VLAHDEGFTDPADFFRYVIDELAADVPADRWVPEMLRGPAHGDLHGRNVLVGLEGNAARWPALFDYEHMAAGNLVGWDFVKLETELKVRAYEHVFPNERPPGFIEGVTAFERDLAERTERHRGEGDWPAPGGDTPAERLRSLVLGLRECAGRHLGSDPRRPDNWLEEYYFLLAAYGVSTAWFHNQAERERGGAFVSAGVAAARYLWRRRRADTLTSEGLP
jgi:hypothetical protein